MDNNYNVFRRATFGGFNRRDVIDYIERIKNEFLEYKNGVEKTIAELRQQISELTELAQTASADCTAVKETVQVPCTAETTDTLKVISAATEELITVADGLSKSLGDFVQTITKGDSSAESTACAATAVTAEIRREKSIDEIVSGFCFAAGEKSVAVIEEKTSKTETLDPLASAGFFTN